MPHQARRQMSKRSASCWSSFRFPANAVDNVLRVRLDRILARCCRGSRLLTIHRADKRNDLPDLVFGDAAAPRRHSIRPAFYDRVEKIGRFATISPVLFDEWWSNSAAAIRVT